MSVSLTKGGNVSLTKMAPGLTAVVRRPRLGRPHHDRRRLRPRRQRAPVRRSAARSSTTSTSSSSTTSSSPDGSVEHTGDNLTGEGEGDDEAIKVNLARVAADGRQDRLPGLDLRRRRPAASPSARSATPSSASSTGATSAELARYDLTEDASTETAMVFGELYRNGGEWKFRAVGQGYASGLAGHRARLRRQRRLTPARASPQGGRRDHRAHVPRPPHSTRERR